jgi:hypothetical protein
MGCQPAPLQKSWMRGERGLAAPQIEIQIAKGKGNEPMVTPQL